MYAEFFLNENDFAVNRPVLIYKFNSLGPFCICQCLDYNFQAPSALKQMPCISVCGTWSNESKIDQILHLLINTEPWFFFFWWWSEKMMMMIEDFSCIHWDGSRRSSMHARQHFHHRPSSGEDDGKMKTVFWRDNLLWKHWYDEYKTLSRITTYVGLVGRFPQVLQRQARVLPGCGAGPASYIATTQHPPSSTTLASHHQPWRYTVLWVISEPPWYTWLLDRGP